MTFDILESSSANRHKARECALQMLFAADMLPNGKFSHLDYWGELGFDELKKGASELFWSVLSKCDTIESHRTQILKHLRKLEPLDRKNSRFYGLDEIQSEVRHFLQEYRKYVDDVVRSRDVKADDVKDHGPKLSGIVDKFVADLEFLAGQIRTKSNDDEFRECFDAANRISTILTEIFGTVIVEIEQLVETMTPTREFADILALGLLDKCDAVDDRIRSRAEHWRIERMAIVDRNVLRLAVYEFEYVDTPNAVVINEALEIARRFSTYEATQFINGILDAIRQDIEANPNGRSKASGSK